MAVLSSENRGKVLLGNEAIAWSLLEAGATILTSYPGTPASEILDTAQKIKEEKGLDIHTEWAINEKVAFEIALTHSWLPKKARLGLISSGVPFAHAYDLIKSLKLENDVALYKVDIPFPLGPKVQEAANRHATTLILEETYPVIELQLTSRERVKGRLDGTIVSEGELTAEILANTILQLLGEDTPKSVQRPSEGSPPRLCPGCPHGAAFWAIRKALPNGIYPSDIGCYTLGINLGAVDTFLCMGTSVAQAEGLYLSFHRAAAEIPSICATISDSTFFHAGVPPLIDSVHQGACFILMILDNATSVIDSEEDVVCLDREETTVEKETILSTVRELTEGTNIFNISTAAALVVTAGGLRPKSGVNYCARDSQ